METKWFATTSEMTPFSPDEYKEVSLSQFAAILGLTGSQYADVITKFIDEDRLLDLLKFEARAEVEAWIIKNGYNEGNGKVFCIALRLSLNKVHDDILYCLCLLGSTLDGPAVLCFKTIAGLANMPSEDVLNLDIFEIMFCDLETNPFGVGNV